MSRHYSEPSGGSPSYSVIAEALTLTHQALSYLELNNSSDLIFFFYSSAIYLTPDTQSPGCFLIDQACLGPLHLLSPSCGRFVLKISTWQLLHFIQIFLLKSHFHEGFPGHPV